MASQADYGLADKPSEMLTEMASMEPPVPPSMELPPERERKVWRRINLRVVVMLAIIYVVSISDRNNLGLAAVAGMTDDLHLVGTRYSVAALVSLC